MPCLLPHRRRVAGLAAQEVPVLRLLYLLRGKHLTPFARGYREPGWCRPRDLGGHRNSSHGQVLRRLARRGWVDQRPYGAPGEGLRQAWMYRLNARGQQAWELYVALTSGRGGHTRRAS